MALMAEQIERLKKAVLLHTEKRMSMLEFAQKYRILPPTSPAPGKYNPRNAPYQAQILEMISESDYDHIFLCFAAQTGKTEILLNAVLYYVAYDPATILVILPTETVARDFTKTRIDPLIKNTPILREKFDWSYKTADNTSTFKNFENGWLAIAWAGSEAQLASRPVRVLLLDEIDRFPILSEGDAYSIAEKRTQAFWNRKIIVSSTPTEEETSRIWAFRQISDVYEYHVPCLSCKQYFKIQWKDVVWEKDQPETARIKCPHCGFLHSEKERRDMIGQGKWVKVQEGEKKGYAWFHLPAMNSLFLKLSDLVEEFLLSKEYPERLRVFVNTVLVEPWKPELQEDTVEADLLRLTFTEQPENLRLGLGVDVQEDRLVATLAGLSPDGTIYVLEHRTFWGVVFEEKVWEELLTWLIEKQPEAVFVDSSAFTERVYEKVAEFRKYRKNVYAIKGLSGSYQVLHKITYLTKPRIPLISLGVDYLKELLFMRLSAKRKILFNSKIATEEYFLELTAERPALKYEKGQARRIWKKIRPRNEAWDCLIYATATFWLQAQGKEKMEITESQPVRALPIKRKRSGWVSHW